MRKILIVFAALLISGSIIAGGLVTNTNQSAMFTRLQNRNASTGIDAVYFNPAGLTRLGNGLFVSVNNQTISQTKTIMTNYTNIEGAPKEYVGDVSAPFFPGIYAAYNTGKLSFSLGFNPIGGGGGAEYKKGLPSFESSIADLVPLMANAGFKTTQYSADIYFEGTSVYFGYQGNIAYKINDQLSLAAGVRLVSAKNTYNGYIRNIQVNPTFPAFGPNKYDKGAMVPATQFFSDGNSTLTALASGSTAAATQLTTAITGGTPASTPLTALPPAQQQAIGILLGAAGISTTGMSIGVAAASLNAVAPIYSQNAAVMASYASQTQDREVDAEETGTGVTPILSANYSPNDQLNIAVRYEFQTNMDLTTSVKQGGGIFVEGEKVVADMPAMLAIGVEYKPTTKLSLAGSFNTYFDKNLDYDGSETENVDMTDKNFLEYGLGLEYGLSQKLRLSAGWVATRTSVNEAYQSDMRYSTNTNSFGAGLGFWITPKIDLNLGGQYTFYAEGSSEFNHPLGSLQIPVTETYNKKTWLVGIGVDFYFGKK